MPDSVKNLSEIINRLKTEETLKNSEMVALSDLSTEDIIRVRMAWEFLPVERKRSIAEQLNEMEEGDAALSFDNLFRFMLTDPDEQVKILAIRGLWENDQPSLLEPLVRLVERDKSQKVRAEAASALGKYTLLAEIGKLREALDQRVTTVLFRVLEDNTENIDVRARALESLSVLSKPQVTEAIKQAYTGGNHRLKLASIYAMGRSASRTWTPILVAELKSDEPAERYEAVMALGEMEDESILEYLRFCIKDEDLEVRLALVDALRKIGGREAKNMLSEMCGDTSESVSEAAKNALADMEDPNLLKLPDEIAALDEDEIEEIDEDEDLIAS